jgi:hypothetical protein
VSANFGSFDKPVDDGRITITEKEFPGRNKSMTPRLQARIVKTHMWEFVPGYDYYLWVDSSCRLQKGGSQWFLNKLGDADIAVFKHPHRNTVQQEADYLKHRLAIKCPYITPRYEGEDIDGQLTAVDPSAPLYASTAFICKDSPVLREAMKEWWYQISRYHSIDQLALPHATQSLRVNIIPDNYLKCEALQYVRNR